jgi:hypothetical protein
MERWKLGYNKLTVGVEIHGGLPEIRKNLPRNKRPRSIVFDQVPHSSTGKIEKPKLRENTRKRINVRKRDSPTKAIRKFFPFLMR